MATVTRHRLPATSFPAGVRAIMHSSAVENRSPVVLLPGNAEAELTATLDRLMLRLTRGGYHLLSLAGLNATSLGLIVRDLKQAGTPWCSGQVGMVITRGFTTLASAAGEPLPELDALLLWGYDPGFQALETLANRAGIPVSHVANDSVGRLAEPGSTAVSGEEQRAIARAADFFFKHLG